MGNKIKYNLKNVHAAKLVKDNSQQPMLKASRALGKSLSKPARR